MSWDIRPFGELYEIPSRNGLMRPSRERGSGFKMINMGELFAYPIIKNPEMERVQVSDNELPKYSVQHGDLLFARQSLVLEGAGKCSIVAKVEEPTVYESHLIRVRLDKKQCDPFFYYYFFNSQVGAGFIQQIVNQVAAAGIRGSELEKLKIIHPPLPIQQKIAAILSAYDDLIENNNKRIALLEKTAEEIYREWFVRMRFPGWKQAKFEKGVPVGWERESMGELCQIARGSSPRPIADDKYFVNGDIPWIKIADATSSKMFIYETREYVNSFGASFSRKLPKGSLIIATSGTLGFCIFLGVEGCVHDGWMYLSDYKKNVRPSFMYYVINSYREHLNNLSYGAAIQNINTGIMRKLPVLIPSKSVLEKFYSVVEPMQEEIFITGQSIIKLKQSRDLLLSRLISGKLSVEGLDIRFPESMAESRG